MANGYGNGYGQLWLWLWLMDIGLQGSGLGLSWVGTGKFSSRGSGKLRACSSSFCMVPTIPIPLVLFHTHHTSISLYQSTYPYYTSYLSLYLSLFMVLYIEVLSLSSHGVQYMYLRYVSDDNNNTQHNTQQNSSAVRVSLFHFRPKNSLTLKPSLRTG